MKEIRIGLLGTGGIAHVHAWAFRALPYSTTGLKVRPNLYMVYDRKIEKAREFANLYGFERYTNNPLEVINSPEVDIIDISLPNKLHAELSILASEKGKHVISEKPLASDLRDAKAMVEAVRKNRVHSLVCLNMRFLPSVMYARKLIEGGRIGRVFHFRGVAGHSRLIDPLVPIEWRMKKELAGGGPLADLGVHIFDIARLLVGDVEEVVSLMNTFIKERFNQSGQKEAVDVEDAGLVLMRFEKGALGSVEATKFALGFDEQQRIEIHGSECSFRIILTEPFVLKLYCRDEDPPGLKNVTVAYDKNIIWPPSKSTEGWAYTFVPMFYNFLNAIADDVDTTPNFYDGLKAQEILEASYLSWEKRSWIKLPLL